MHYTSAPGLRNPPPSPRVGGGAPPAMQLENLECTAASKDVRQTQDRRTVKCHTGFREIILLHPRPLSPPTPVDETKPTTTTNPVVYTQIQKKNIHNTTQNALTPGETQKDELRRRNERRQQAQPFQALPWLGFNPYFRHNKYFSTPTT